MDEAVSCPSCKSFVRLISFVVFNVSFDTLEDDETSGLSSDVVFEPHLGDKGFQCRSSFSVAD